MTGQESAISIRDWIDEETRHVDIVASWESLCDTYDELRFTDPLSDAERLDEYKWIIQQMNSFLTRMRTKLLSCKDLETMAVMLMESMHPKGSVQLGERKALVYHKLRQRWIRMTVEQVRTMLTEQMMESEEQDGWTE